MVITQDAMDLGSVARWVTYEIALDVAAGKYSPDAQIENRFTGEMNAGFDGIKITLGSVHGRIDFYDGSWSGAENRRAKGVSPDREGYHTVRTWLLQAENDAARAKMDSDDWRELFDAMRDCHLELDTPLDQIGRNCFVDVETFEVPYDALTGETAALYRALDGIESSGAVSYTHLTLPTN